jgi:hypothetical protein
LGESNSSIIIATSQVSDVDYLQTMARNMRQSFLGPSVSYGIFSTNSVGFKEKSSVKSSHFFLFSDQQGFNMFYYTNFLIKSAQPFFTKFKWQSALNSSRKRLTSRPLAFWVNKW